MLVSVLVLATAATPFEFIENIDGVRVEAREVSGSSFSELRLSTTSAASVDALCDAAFGDGTVPKGDPYLRERKVLRATQDERVTYDLVVAPLVAERDYALRTQREKRDGVCVVSFKLAPDAAPPPVRGRVRLQSLNGTWRFVRTAQGVTEVTYTAFAEPGGDLTAFIAERPRRRTEVDVVRRTLARAAR